MLTHIKYIFIFLVGTLLFCRCDSEVRFSTIPNPAAPTSAADQAPPAPYAGPPFPAELAAPSSVKSETPAEPETPAVAEDKAVAPPPPPAQSVVLSPVINAVAFEDLYSKREHPERQPDFDYNDFLTNFKIQEVVNSDNQITDIVIDFYPRAVGAGFDHVFYLVLTGVKTTPSKNRNSLPVTKPMFAGSAQVTLAYFDADGAQVGDAVETPYDRDIVVYPSTHAIFAAEHERTNILGAANSFAVFNTLDTNYRMSNRNARVHIALDRPELNAYSGESFDPSTFRVVLHPIKTNYDIDIINVDPKNFVGSSGYPWGFIIPTDWQWMKEGVRIDKGYPEFKEYRKFLRGQIATGDYMNWYNYPVGVAHVDEASTADVRAFTVPNIGAYNSVYLYPSVPWRETMPRIE